MHPSILSCVTLIALCIALLACSDEPSVAPPAEEMVDEPKAIEFAEIIVEIDSIRHFPESGDQAALGLLRALAAEEDSDDIKVQVKDEREGQLHLTIRPAEQAEAFYTTLKARFDQAARDAVQTELSVQQAIVKTKAEAFQAYQQLMKQFQLGVATVEVDGKKLDRRKLDRLVETTLASQIAAEKRIEALQKQVDREQYATLLRLR